MTGESQQLYLPSIAFSQCLVFEFILFNISSSSETWKRIATNSERQQQNMHKFHSKNEIKMTNETKLVRVESSERVANEWERERARKSNVQKPLFIKYAPSAVDN